ncbi:MAG: hypothetical protein LUO93_05725 [Methanomicrobiales archaeon]|nr:hypothetical protein [Methanomicrobiales archaeon]
MTRGTHLPPAGLSVALRDRLKTVVAATAKQAEVDRSAYVSVRELLGMLGPNIKSAQSLYGMMGNMGIETIRTNHNGVKNTWLTEAQAKTVIHEVLSHPVRTRITGDTE